MPSLSEILGNAFKGRSEAWADIDAEYKRRHGVTPPTVRDYVTSGIDWANKNYGPKEWNRFDNTSAGLASDLTQTLEDTTPIGVATAAGDTDQALAEGNYLGAGLAALGLIPGARPAKKVAETAVKMATKELPEIMSSAVAAPAVRTKPAEITSTFSKRPNQRAQTPEAELRAAYEQSGPALLDPPQFNPEDIPIGSAFIIGPGDRTDTGKRLLGINGREYENPVDLRGGYNFQAGIEQQNPDKLSWKSGKDVVEGYAKSVRAAEKAGAERVFFGNSLMGKHAGDFSEMPVLAALEEARLNKISPANAAELDKLIQKKAGPYQWPGLEAVLKDKSLLDAWVHGGGTQRKAVLKAFESETGQKLGAPDIAGVRQATTAPELRDAPVGMTSQKISELDPGGRVVDKPIVTRADYPTGLGGKLFAKMPEGIPYDVMMHDYVQGQRAKFGKIDQQNELYAIERAKPFQIWDNQQLDRVMNYLRSKEGKTLGFGGALAAGLMTREQAEDLDRELSRPDA
jgi:hypothetical protein